MLRAPLLLLLVAACSAAPRARSRLPSKQPRLDGRIVGGEPVEISQYPWQLSLQEVGAHLCGASVISSSWALTAAHCLDVSWLILVSLRAGTSSRGSGGTVYEPADAFYHEYYDSSTTDYDIGVIQIVGSFSFDSNVQAVGLSTTEPEAGTVVTITGWGYLSSGGEFPRLLQAVTTTIVSRSSCNSTYGSDITERMICAGGAGKDSCQGDTGGPLVAGNTQYGIVSWGAGCGIPGYPDVYTNVASLRDWVTEATGV